MNETVRARVLKQGHNRVFTGAYDETSRTFTKFATGDEFDIAPDIAEALAARGFVEVLTARAPVALEPTPLSPAVAPAPAPAQQQLANLRDARPRPFHESPLQPFPDVPADEEERAKWSALAIARLLLHAKRNTRTGCLEWQGAKHHRGYGVITLLRMSYTTHRLSWLAHKGSISRGLFVCHRCDNPACFEITHLFLGTPQENMDDMVRKGRSVRIGRPVLTEDKVAEIKRRLENRESVASLSREYDMGYRAIADIKHGRTWRQVSPQR